MTFPRRLRILHIIPTLTGGGAENFLCALAQSFDPAAIDVGILSVYPSDVPLPPQALERIRVVSLARRGRFDLGFFPRMIRAIKAFAPDVVHAHLHNGKYWGRLAALAARVPVVLFTEHNPCGEVRILPEIAVDWVVNRFTDGIVTFAQQQRDLLARAEALPPEKVVVIENGIALPPPPTPELRAAARARLGARDEEFAVVVLARLIKRKNQQLAIAAAARLSGEAKERIRIYIVGGGEDDAMLRERAREERVADRVVFLGNQEDPVGLLYGADLFYMPSLAEGMPLAVLEAMSVGLPVISAPWTGIAELLHGGELGTVLADWEPATSAAVLERAFYEPEPYREKARLALEIVRKLHDVKRIARLHEKLYFELAGVRGVTGRDAALPAT